MSADMAVWDSSCLSIWSYHYNLNTVSKLNPESYTKKTTINVTHMTDDAFNNTALVSIVSRHDQDAAVHRPDQSWAKHYR